MKTRIEAEFGYGRVAKKDLVHLKESLVKAYNQQIAKLSNQQLKEAHLQIATSESTVFPIIRILRSGRIIRLGKIRLFPTKGEFLLRIHKNTCVVQHAFQSLVYRTLYDFMFHIPINEKKFGAKTYYWNEYHQKNYTEFPEPADYQYFGAWIPKRTDSFDKKVYVS